MQPLLDAAAGFKDVPKVREIIGERRGRAVIAGVAAISTGSRPGCSPALAVCIDQLARRRPCRVRREAGQGKIKWKSVKILIANTPGPSAALRPCCLTAPSASLSPRSCTLPCLAFSPFCATSLFDALATAPAARRGAARYSHRPRFNGPSAARARAARWHRRSFPRHHAALRAGFIYRCLVERARCSVLGELGHDARIV